MKHIVLPEVKDRSLVFYLAMEEFVAREIEGEAFFVWRVDPTVIMGGCVYSDKGNIMISYISGRGDVSEVFERYLDMLTSCLRSLGLPAEKSGRNDILVDGRKVSGNAFHMLPDRSIVHGTLLYSTDFDALEAAIRPPVEKLERHGVASVRQRVTNLSESLDPSVIGSVEQLEDYLVSHFTDVAVMLSPQQITVIEELAKEYTKYI